MKNVNLTNRKKVQGFFLILALCLIFFLCKKETPYYQTSGHVFNTNFAITYKYARVLDEEIQDCFRNFNLTWNPFNRESIVYKVNNNEPVEVDDWFITVFNKAMEVSEISDGTYDITCGPFINLWGFGPEKLNEITDIQHVIDSLKQFVGYRKIRLEGRQVIKDDPRLQLNASSIAKGYACDVIAKLLDSLGIKDYLVDIGGEVRAKGKNPSGRYWRIQIPKPFHDASGLINEEMAVIELCNKSIATSGNYRNYRIIDGKKMGHTIDPLTGYPSEKNILSASVIHRDCMTADAFATAFMTKDLDEALALADRIQDLDYLFVYADENGDFQIKMSTNMKQYLIR
jgi:thiamine biosynthesis lipoprotein